MSESTWYRTDKDGRLVLTLYIQPNASRTEIAGLHDGALKIKVAAPPADHQANDKLTEFLGKAFKVGKKQVLIRRGETSRLKVVEITDPTIAPDQLLASVHG